ncbi:MAG: type II secretion system protein [Oscillospiraceae bacterium]
MKTNKNVKGFTLVELIVVIAIIGVLAAILVPSMLGYVKKSKVSSMNANAKSLFDAANTSCIELDSEGDQTTLAGLGDESLAGTTAGADGFAGKVYNYFNGVEDLVTADVRIEANVCVAALAADNVYRGTYPNAASVDNYDQADLDKAQNGYT